MNSKIFISRDLSADSPFHQQLTAAGHQVHGESLLSFTPVPFKYRPVCDWLFFYSQRGVQFFFEQFEKFPGSNAFDYKCGAMGPATASALKYHIGVEPDFTGTGFPQKTADLFSEKAAGEIVCFVQARNSVGSIQKILEEKLRCEDLIVYDNNFKKHITLPHFDILVFTSPMNARAYFSKYEIKENQKVIAIGGTTKNALVEMLIDCYVSERPSEEAMAKQVLAIISSQT